MHVRTILLLSVSNYWRQAGASTNNVTFLSFKKLYFKIYNTIILRSTVITRRFNLIWLRKQSYKEYKEFRHFWPTLQLSSVVERDKERGREVRGSLQGSYNKYNLRLLLKVCLAKSTYKFWKLMREPEVVYRVWLELVRMIS